MRRIDLSPENCLKPRLTILLNNPCTHNQRYYVVGVVRHRKVSAAGILKLEIGLRCRLEYEHFLHIQPACKIGKICEEFSSPAMGRGASADAVLGSGNRRGKSESAAAEDEAARDRRSRHRRTDDGLARERPQEREGRRSGSRVKILCRVLRLLQWSLHFG